MGKKSINSNEKKISAKPTKEFFIGMLTRDISLARSIIDLIDNSIDGAKKLRPKEDFTGLHVKVTLNKDSFSIEDNCGGFDLDTATKYAFRFGRVNEAGYTKHSIGRFGVGMKRSLFKMGEQFSVQSPHKNDHFLVSVDVNEWLEKPDEWDFDYVEKSDFPTELNKLKWDGTSIEVTNLYPNIAIDFQDDVFKNDLSKEISLALNVSILKGLKIFIDGVPIKRRDVSFLWSKDLKPFFKELKMMNGKVNVQIFAGIGEPEPKLAGWYIFCNDRLVLEADKSFATGWKESKEDESSIIQYHNKFAMFRGVVIFNSDDPDKLPMTTTKTGIDTGHSIFKSTRPEMILAMKQVLGFLHKINDKDVRDDIVSNATKKDIEVITKDTRTLNSKFVFPTIKTVVEASKLLSISYPKERTKIDKLKAFLGVSSNREVGEKTFDFFYNINKKDL